jgi:hypothetical protein
MADTTLLEDNKGFKEEGPLEMMYLLYSNEWKKYLNSA